MDERRSRAERDVENAPSLGYEAAVDMEEAMKRGIEILSPVALGAEETKALAPRLESLAGKRLGIRRDHAWRSFDVFAGEVAHLARERLGVAEVVLFDPESRIGTPERESAKVAEFARGVDAAIVGLGT